MFAKLKAIPFCNTYIRWSNELGIEVVRLSIFKHFLWTYVVAIKKAYLLFNGFEI